MKLNSAEARRISRDDGDEGDDSCNDGDGEVVVVVVVVVVVCSHVVCFVVGAFLRHS